MSGKRIPARRLGRDELQRFCPAPIEDRLWAQVEIAGPDECWLWRGYLTNGGYGQIGLNYKSITVHRASYEVSIGPIPAGMCVLHRCDVRACVNPAHLFLGTHRDNTQDMVRKGRAHGQLSDEFKRTIARAEGGQREVARRFGVSHRTVAAAKGKFL